MTGIELPEDFEFPNGIDLNKETGEFTITIPEDTEEARQLYRTSPVFHGFVRNACRVHIRVQTGDKYPDLQPYTIDGFLYMHSGETFDEVDIDDL